MGVLPRPVLSATFVALVGIPAWLITVSGLVQVRACQPVEAGGLFGAHVALLVPQANCSGPDGVGLALVGTVAIASVVAWIAGAGLLGAAWFALRRAANRLARLVRAAWAAVVSVPSAVVVRHVTRLRMSRVEEKAGLFRWVSAVVGLRAPPFAA